MTFSAIKKLLYNMLNTYVHFSPCRGTASENISYCSKDDNYFEYGEEPKQGERKDLAQLRDMIKNEGLTINEILTEYDPNIYYMWGRTLKEYCNYYDNLIKRNFVTTCEWLYGKTKLGKSKYAFEQIKDKSHYIHSIKDNGWWDGYKGEEVVIIDEFRANKSIDFSMLLQLIDRYPYKVNRRGQEPRQFISKHIIITCPQSPQQCFKNKLEEDDNINQLLRRITVRHFTKDEIKTIPYLDEDEEENLKLKKSIFKIFKSDWLRKKYSDNAVDETNIIKKNRWNRHKNMD